MIEMNNRVFLPQNKPKRFTIHYLLFTLIALLLFTACGYKPSARMIHHLFDDKVYVKVYVDRVEPENAPFVKDEMNRMVYQRFHGQIVSRDEAQSQIFITYKGTRFYPLSYTDGYVTRYRVNVRVHFTMVTKRGKLSKTITSQYESDIQPSALSSSQLRIDAIRKGLEKAMDEFLAYASVKGMLLLPSDKAKDE